MQVIPSLTIDTTGEECPVPVLMAKMAISRLNRGEILAVLATKEAADIDIPAWLLKSGHKLLAEERNGTVVRFLVEKIERII